MGGYNLYINFSSFGVGTFPREFGWRACAGAAVLAVAVGGRQFGNGGSRRGRRPARAVGGAPLRARRARRRAHAPAELRHAQRHGRRGYHWRHAPAQRRRQHRLRQRSRPRLAGVQSVIYGSTIQLLNGGQH